MNQCHGGRDASTVRPAGRLGHGGPSYRVPGRGTGSSVRSSSVHIPWDAHSPLVARETNGAAPPAVLVAIWPPLVGATCVRPALARGTPGSLRCRLACLPLTRPIQLPLLWMVGTGPPEPLSGRAQFARRDDAVTVPTVPYLPDARPLPAHRCGDGWSMAIIVACSIGEGRGRTRRPGGAPRANAGRHYHCLMLWMGGGGNSFRSPCNVKSRSGRRTGRAKHPSLRRGARGCRYVRYVHDHSNRVLPKEAPEL